MSTEKEPQAVRRGIMYRFSFAVDTFMRNSFFRLGLFVASHPIKVILATVVLTVLCGLGFARFRSESRGEKLWVPQGTIAVRNQEYVSDRYGRTNRLVAIVFKAKDSSKGLATKSAFLDMLQVAETAFYTSTLVTIDGKQTNVTHLDRCVKTADLDGNRLCQTITPFGLFYKSDNVVFRDDQVNFYATVRKEIETLSDEEISKTLRNPPPKNYDGIPFNAEELYAPSNDSGKPIQVMNHYQFSVDLGEVENGEVVDDVADALERAWTLRLTENSDDLPQNNVEWFVNSAWGQTESLSEALSGDVPLLTYGFVLLGLYVIIFLGDFHFIRSHRLLALSALATTGFAIVTCFGLSSAIGMFYGPVHQILPLLLIGIGIDDCFHVTRAADEMFLRDEHKDKSVRVRMALALSQAGTAITVTSFTNVVVFLLSAISRLPALRYFSIWAAIGIFFAWLYSITFYTAFVTLDMRRIQSRRLDCVPCCKPRDVVKETNWFGRAPNGFNRFFEHQFGPLIMQPVVRIVMLILFAAGLGVCIYGCSQLYLKFRFAFFYPTGSYQREYQDVIDEYFKLGDSSFVYVRGQKLSETKNQERLLELCGPNGTIAKNKWVQESSVDCWFPVMLGTPSYKPSNNGPLYEPDEFVRRTIEFIDDGVFKRYNKSVLFNEDRTEVIDTRFGFQYLYRESNVDEINGLKSVRESADSVGFGEVDGIPAAFPYTFLDTFVEQYDALGAEIGTSLGLACVAVAVVCFILIGHPIVAIISLVVVGMIIIDVLGLTHFTGYNLNSVSVITLVLVTGISVDFVVHIARAFLEHVGSKRERAIKALTTMGPPVFYAGFSTFLAIIVLAGARSYIFKVIFWGFFFLIVFAFLHGLILGPILLSLLGPASFYADEQEKMQAEKELEERFTGKVDTVEQITTEEEVSQV